MSLSIDLKTKYDQQYASGASAWRDLGGLPKAKRVIELARRHGLQPRSLIEVGCGEGSILKHLDAADFCPEMYAVDISTTGIEVLKNRRIASVKEALVFDGYRLPYEDKSFDLAICAHVLEHVEFERTLLREIRRVASRAIIEVPIDFRPQADERLQHFLGYGHINMYSPTTIRFLLKTEGFQIIDDIVAIVDPEISCYNYFRNQKKEVANEENITRKMAEWEKAAADFHAKDRRAQEATASEYTMLVEHNGEELKIFGT